MCLNTERVCKCYIDSSGWVQYMCSFTVYETSPVHELFSQEERKLLSCWWKTDNLPCNRLIFSSFTSTLHKSFTVSKYSHWHVNFLLAMAEHHHSNPYKLYMLCALTHLFNIMSTFQCVCELCMSTMNCRITATLRACCWDSLIIIQLAKIQQTWLKVFNLNVSFKLQKL